MAAGNGGANPYRGETVLSLAGKSYILRLSVNVLCVIEEALGVRGNVAETLRVAGVTVSRATFHAALTTPNRRGERHLPTETSVEAVGWMLDDEGPFLRGSPIWRAYWELVYHVGYLTNEEAEVLGIVTAGKTGADSGGAATPGSAEVEAQTPAGA